MGPILRMRVQNAGEAAMVSDTEPRGYKMDSRFCKAGKECSKMLIIMGVGYDAVASIEIVERLCGLTQ